MCSRGCIVHVEYRGYHSNIQKLSNAKSVFYEGGIVQFNWGGTTHKKYILFSTPLSERAHQGGVNSPRLKNKFLRIQSFNDFLIHAEIRKADLGRASESDDDVIKSETEVVTKDIIG